MARPQEPKQVIAVDPQTVPFCPELPGIPIAGAVIPVLEDCHRQAWPPFPIGSATCAIESQTCPTAHYFSRNNKRLVKAVPQRVVPVQTFGIAAKPSRPSLEHKPRAVRESLVDLKFVSLCGDSIVRVVLALSQCVQECLGGFRRYQGRGYVNALIIFVLIPMLSCFGDQIALM